MGQGPLAVSAFKGPTGSGVGGVTPSADLQGAAFMGQRHGKYYEGNYGGTTFSGANQAGATLSAGLATTYVGLCLSNPAASGKNLVLQRARGLIIVAPAALLSLGLIGGWISAGLVTHTTALTPINNRVGNTATPAGKLDAAATLPATPTWIDWLSENTASAGFLSFDKDFDGSLILIPGAFLAVGASVAGPAAGFVGYMEWEELPV